MKVEAKRSEVEAFRPIEMKVVFTSEVEVRAFQHFLANWHKSGALLGCKRCQEAKPLTKQMLNALVNMLTGCK